MIAPPPVFSADVQSGQRRVKNPRKPLPKIIFYGFKDSYLLQ
jgi:hypothetical protein